MSDRVICRIDAGVADVRLNRPDKLNALDMAMFAALGEVGDALRADRSVRAVVLSGEGRGFCAGLDLSVFGSSAPAAGAPAGAGVGALLGGRGDGRIDNRAQHAAWVWHEMEVPVIAAVHGVALGGGLQIALGADLRLVAPDARLSVLEVRWGLVPDMTGTRTLPRLVGLDVAKELTWTGRMVDGDEAVRMGLATRVGDNPLDAGLALAHELAGQSPQAIRAAKPCSTHVGSRPRRAPHGRVRGHRRPARLGEPGRSGRRVTEKRPPRFDDRVTRAAGRGSRGVAGRRHAAPTSVGRQQPAATPYDGFLVTEAPDMETQAAPTVNDTDAVEAFVAEWRLELANQSSISASHVQDRLLDLWGSLPESATRLEVERWLTETLERHLYAVNDIKSRLESVLSAS